MLNSNIDEEDVKLDFAQQNSCFSCWMVICFPFNEKKGSNLFVAVEVAIVATKEKSDHCF